MLFLFLVFVDFIEYLPSHMQMVKYSCYISFATTLQLHQAHWTKASIQVNQQLGLFVFLLLSFLSAKLPPLPLSLSYHLWLSLFPPPTLSALVIKHGKVVLINALFIIVGALGQATVCSLQCLLDTKAT